MLLLTTEYIGDVVHYLSEWGSFLASGGHKTRKTLFRDPENPLFGLENSFICHLRPSEAKNDLLALKTIFFFLKSGLFMFSGGGSFLASGGRKTQKTLFRGPKNPFFGRSLARGG